MGNKAIYDEMDIHCHDTSNHVVSMFVLGWRLNKRYLVRKLSKLQRLACLTISLAFPVTPTSALEILLNVRGEVLEDTF